MENDPHDKVDNIILGVLIVILLSLLTVSLYQYFQI
jgi:hypothetical protein